MVCMNEGINQSFTKGFMDMGFPLANGIVVYLERDSKITDQSTINPKIKIE